MRGAAGSRKSQTPRSTDAEGIRTLWRRHSCKARGPETLPGESTEQTTQPVIQSPPSRIGAEVWQVFPLAASAASHSSLKPAPGFRRPTPGLHLTFAHLFSRPRRSRSMPAGDSSMRRIGVGAELRLRSSRSDPVLLSRSIRRLISPCDPLAGTSTCTRMRPVCWERLSDRTSGSEPSFLANMPSCGLLRALEIHIIKTLQTSAVSEKSGIILGNRGEFKACQEVNHAEAEA